MPRKKDPLAPLRDALEGLLAWLRATDVPGLVIGGVAVGLVSRPRVTRDLDAVVFLGDKDVADFVAAGQPFGFVPRVADVIDFASESRVLLLCHQPSGIDIDVSLGALPFEVEALDRCQTKQTHGLTVPLPTPEDLIIMKAVAHRDRDLIDISGIVEVHPDLDVERIRRWVRDFADTLEMPEIYDDMDKLLPQSPKGRKGRRKS